MKFVLCSRIRAISGAALLWCLSGTASADECALTVSQPVLDFGQTQRTQLMQGAREGQRLLVGTRVISLNLSCAANTGVALGFTGERATDQGYRFAQDGFFTLKVLSAQLDGKPVHLMVRDGEGGMQDSDNQLRPGVSLTPGYQNQIARGSKFSAQVEVSTYVDMRDTRVRSQSQWNGGGQFSIDTF